MWSLFDNCEKLNSCKEFLLFKVKSLQTSPQWDSGKMWFKEMLSLAKSMTLLPRSPTVIKWVNDWIKLLMVGWARWPLRSCQVSISENQEFYQSSTHGALCWIWPPRKLRSQQNVSLFVSIFISLFFPLTFKPLARQSSLSRLSVGLLGHRGKGFDNWIQTEAGKGHMWHFAPEQRAVWSGRLSFNLSGPQIPHQ